MSYFEIKMKSRYPLFDLIGLVMFFPLPKYFFVIRWRVNVSKMLPLLGVVMSECLQICIVSCKSAKVLQSCKSCKTFARTLTLRSLFETQLKSFSDEQKLPVGSLLSSGNVLSELFSNLTFCN